MRKFALIFTASAAAAFGQAMVEKAAIGAAGAAGGAAVGKGLLGVLQKLDGGLQSAGGGVQSTSGVQNTGNIGPGGGASGRAANLTPQQRLARAESGMAGAAAAQSAAVIPPVKVADLTAEQIQSIEVGWSRADLLSKLGNPAMKMTLPGDGGKELEIYRYRSGGKDAAVVQLLAGVVSSVERVN